MDSIQAIKDHLKGITYGMISDKYAEMFPGVKAPTKDSLLQFFNGNTKGWSEETKQRIYEAAQSLIIERGKKILEALPEGEKERLLAEAA